jgi:thiol-disulfide isomerase/thioredoxin
MRPFSIVILLFVVVACFGMTIPTYGDPPSGQPERVQEKQDSPLPYKLGDVPPTIEVNRWNDGQQHSLDEFRGKIVVIEFTGMWCGVCRKSAPTMRRLVELYRDQDVVFFGIHTPTDDDKGVARMMSDDGWPLLIAIDERTDPADKVSFNGKTAANYGILGWPTIVVLDRQGRVSSSGTIVDRTMTPEQAEPIYKRCAAKANIEYPMPEDLSETAKSDWIRRLSFEWHREWIDKALNLKP